jgi:lipopolysaccharide export system protein LptC
MKRRSYRLLDQLSLYLPVVLMGFLALGTWWLVRNAPSAVQQEKATTVSDKPDYFMREFSVKNFDAQGQLQSEVTGTVARHFPMTDTLEIEQARMRSIGIDGQITTATADRAITNADGSDVRLFGNAIVTRKPGPQSTGAIANRNPMEFRGEYLHARTQPDRVESNLPVVLLRGNDKLTADTLQYDHSTQTLQLKGRVTGMLLPQAKP